jgi:tryptophan synthase alpha subunit
MDNRIDQRFLQLRREGTSGFMAYITGRDPTPEKTVDIALALSVSEAGIDFLEIGIHFLTLWRTEWQISSARSARGGRRRF